MMRSSQSGYWTTGATAVAASGDKWKSLTESALEPKRPGREISRAALLGIGMVLGTGAVTPALTASTASSAGPFIVSAQALKGLKRFEVLSPAEQIIAIRSLLGLNVLELAAILHVQRPTIYSWQSGAATPHCENGSRLRLIYELAQRWGRMCSEPIGDWARRPLNESGRTLVAVLSAEVVDERVIKDAFEGLRSKLEKEAESFVGVRERARRYGYKDRSKAKQESALDRETLL